MDERSSSSGTYTIVFFNARHGPPSSDRRARHDFRGCPREHAIEEERRRRGGRATRKSRPTRTGFEKGVNVFSISTPRTGIRARPFAGRSVGPRGASRDPRSTRELDEVVVSQSCPTPGSRHRAVVILPLLASAVSQPSMKSGAAAGMMSVLRDMLTNDGRVPWPVRRTVMATLRRSFLVIVGAVGVGVLNVATVAQSLTLEKVLAQLGTTSLLTKTRYLPSSPRRSPTKYRVWAGYTNGHSETLAPVRLPVPTTTRGSVVVRGSRCDSRRRQTGPGSRAATRQRIDRGR